MTAETYGAFVEAMRRGQVYGEELGQLVPISRLERGRNFAIESFDFGDLLDPSSLNALTIPPEGEMVDIPDQDRAFIFTLGGVRKVLIQRWGVQDYADDDGGPRFWFYVYEADKGWVSRDRNEAEWAPLVRAANHALANPQFIEMAADGDAVKAANNRLRMAGKPRLPATLVISLTRVRRRSDSAQGTGTGSAKRPHGRVAHERRLPDGRVVKVRACRVHADEKGEPINYVVRAE